MRWPLAVLTYLLTHTSTTAMRDLAGLVRAAGFAVSEEQLLPGRVMMVVAAAGSGAG